jgi:peptidoglycan/LPS O-acetylase OafA/YrhL
MHRADLNNFDLIRLFAAVQVALLHAVAHLNVKLDWLYLLEYFPGVPIFFFISGFLIYQSWNNIQANRMRIFFTNRFLRLFPALFFCVFLTILSITCNGYLATTGVDYKEFLIWLAAQLTLFQFYNPDFLRAYGVGTVNGSLWTVSVELQFYMLIPIIGLLFKRYLKFSYVLFIGLALFSFLNSQINAGHTMFEKILNVTFVPWIFMFLFGAYLASSNYLQEKIQKISLLFLIPINIIIFSI